MLKLVELQLFISAVKEVGKKLLEMQKSTLEVNHKGPIDLVTNADLYSEEKLKELVQRFFPSLPVVSEESFTGSINYETFFVIDPLDGTTNFAHRLPWFGISIALIEAGKPILGIIYHPALDELFFAEKGKGAYLNGERIKVSDTKDLQEALLSTGFPVSKIIEKPEPYLVPFREFLKKSQGVRRFGAATLDLAYTACGRYDGFYEPYLKPWDTMAGVVLVEEAWGKVSDYYGNPYTLSSDTIVAANPYIHERLVEVLKDMHPEKVKPFRNPFPTVDVIIEYEGKIVLIERKNPPYGYALPGGFVEYGETLEECAIREAKEETGLDVEDLELLSCYSDPKRDPRFHTITTVFVAKGKGTLKAGDDAKRAFLVSIDQIPWDNLCFDHGKILKDYLDCLNRKKANAKRNFI